VRRVVAAVAAAAVLEAAAPAAPRVSAAWYEADDYARAREEQRATSAAMVLYVYTDWCPYCRAFEKGLLYTPEVERYLRANAVKVRVNPETTLAARALAQRLGARAYPSFFVRRPGQPPEKVAVRVEGRLKTPAEFIAELERRARRRPS
jgi:thiol:disulfide interchange protein